MSGTVSYSQVGEDLQIAYLLGNPAGVTYIDVGCLWPQELSNTYFFYERDGHGLAIDPNPDVADEWAELRPRDTFLNAAIGAEPGRLSYYRFRNPVFNTCSAERAERVVRRGKGRPGREPLETVDVEVITLDEAVRRTGFAERGDGKLDLLTIDVEGLEVDVLRGFSFDALRPRLIVCELLRSEIDERPEDTAAARLLRAHGYGVAAYTGHDIYFLETRN